MDASGSLSPQFKNIKDKGGVEVDSYNRFKSCSRVEGKHRPRLPTAMRQRLNGQRNQEQRNHLKIANKDREASS
jgi:hypothetical protein